MKILILSHISELLGGAERSILEVMDIWQKQHGIEPEFIIRKPVGTLANELNKKKWKYHSLEYEFWSVANPPETAYQKHKSALTNTQAVLKIEKIIEKSKPDVVLTNSVVCPWAALAAHFTGVPHVWFVREYGDLDHGRIFDIGQRKTFEDVGLLSSLVIANSEALTNHIAQYIPKDKLATLYHPFNMDRMIKASEEPIKSSYRNKNSLKLVITGSIAESKGHLEVIEAVGHMNEKGFDTELCVIARAGEPEFMDRLESLIKKWGIKRKVHFVGYKKNPMPYVKLADIGLMASRMEAFGRVTFEYMTLNKPVVGVGAGGTPEMVAHDVNGYLFEYRNTRSLVKALEHYSNNKTLIEKHGKNGHKKAIAMMSGDHNVDALYERVSNVMQNGGDSSAVLNFSHEWLKYPNYSQQYIDELGVVSVKKLFVLRLKNKVREYITSLKAIYRRLFR